MSKLYPTGHYVLIETLKIEEQTEAGIYLPQGMTMKEEAATEQGEVISFGPCAYVGWAGCEEEGSSPHSQWGIEVGDWVEFRKYEGKKSAMEGKERYRYIPDTHIVGKVIKGDL